MELKDVILQKNDIVTFRNGTVMMVDGSVGKRASEYPGNVKKIERPTEFKTLYEAPKKILDKEEKEYLSAVIKPFRDRVTKIEKVDCNDKQFLQIYMVCETVALPYFKSNTMYKGMEANKRYKLSELGL